MTVNYTTLLGFALPVTGTESGTWGTTVNDSITELVEDSIAATATASVASGDWTLSTTGSGATNQARCAILIPTGSPGVSRNIIAPSQSKAYVVINQSNAAVVLKGSATTGTTIGAGDRAVVAWNGSDFVTVASSATDGVSTISFGTTGLTPNTATSGAVTVAGTLGVANGGTGNTTIAARSVFVANTADTLTTVTPTAGQSIRVNAGNTAWEAYTPSSGTGDVVGPASATDNAVARFDLTTGKLIQNSAVTIADTTGDITGGAYNKVTITPPATAATLTIADGKTLTANNSITLAGTDATTMTFPATSTTVAGLGIAQTFTQDQTIAGNLTLNAQGDVRFADSDSSNWVAFQGPATVASNVTWTLPSADGTSGQVLQTNGSGTLSFATPGGGALTNNTRQAVTSSATTTINLNSGNVIDLTMADNITTLSFTNVPASGTPILIQIVVRNAASGTAYTITWPNSVYWSGQYAASTVATVQTAPTLATGANGVSVIALLTTDGGTKWRGWVEATIPGGSLAELYTWGRSYFGALGTNLISPNASSPVQVGALNNWGGPIVGRNQSFTAIKTDGTMWSWGSNDAGELGINNISRRSSPVQVGSLTNWSNVSSGPGGNFVIATKADGTLWGWGSNDSGQIGDNTRIYRSSPVQIGALNNWALASAGKNHCVALKTDGTLWAWGGNGNFQIGDQTNISRSSPVQIGALTTWADVGAGYNASYAITTSGAFWVWGYNGAYGKLGQNNRPATGGANSYSSPVQVGSLTNWSKIFPGNNGWFALKTDGTLWGCGQNNGGRIGDNSTINKSSPVQVGSDTNWLQATTSSGNVVSGAVKTNGTLWTWGADAFYGQPARGSLFVSSPTQIGTETNWLQVRMGGNSSAGTRGSSANPA